MHKIISNWSNFYAKCFEEISWDKKKVLWLGWIGLEDCKIGEKNVLQI